MATKLPRYLLMASVGALMGTTLLATQASAQMDTFNSRNNANARESSSANVRTGDHPNVRGDIRAQDTRNANVNARAQATVRDTNINAPVSDRTRTTARTNVRTRVDANIRTDDTTRFRRDLADRRFEVRRDRRVVERGPSVTFSYSDPYYYDAYAYAPYESDSYYTYAAETPACTCRDNLAWRRW